MATNLPRGLRPDKPGVNPKNKHPTLYTRTCPLLFHPDLPHDPSIQTRRPALPSEPNARSFRTDLSPVPSSEPTPHLPSDPNTRPVRPNPPLIIPAPTCRVPRVGIGIKPASCVRHRLCQKLVGLNRHKPLTPGAQIIYFQAVHRGTSPTFPNFASDLRAT